MSEDIDELKRDYRRITSPPHLQTRIRAEVSEQTHKGHSLLPATAAIIVGIAALWILPFAWQQQSSNLQTPTKPSLSALAALKPVRPSVGTPSLSNVRSVSVPKLPAKPILTPAKPQSNIDPSFDLKNTDLEEKHHAHI